MEQIERICEMEATMDRCRAAADSLLQALDRYRLALPELQRLLDYVQSEAWMTDHDADEAGLLPVTLKRGILSEDGMSDLMAADAALRQQLISLTQMLTDGEENT